jgi:hypothetical protein
MQSPDRGRWCEEHQRRECVSPRKGGRGDCHSPRMVRGTDKCRMHLGKKAQPVIAEAKAMDKARRAVETYGLPRDISPSEALLEEVRYTAGHVAWLREQVQALEAGELVWGMREQVEKNATEFAGVDTTYAATANIWLELYYRERKHLVDVTKAAITAGIEERKVRLAEQQGALVAQVIGAILADLDLSPGQAALVSEIVPRHLRALAG